MKQACTPQERIRSIMNKIEAELAHMRQNEIKPKAPAVIREFLKPLPIKIQRVSTSSPAKSSSTRSPVSVKVPEFNDDEVKMDDQFKQRALRAYKQRKIFTVYGNYLSIRRALVRRGWVEKCAPGRLQKLEKLSYVKLIKGARRGNEYEIAIMSKLVQCYAPNFIWQPKYFKDQYMNLTPIRNRVRRTRYMDFSTKVGLIGCFEQSHWNMMHDVAEPAIMPSFKLSGKEDELYFLDEFRLTQCISALTYLIACSTPSDLFDENGLVSINIFEFPMRKIENFMKAQEQEEIDTSERNDDPTQWDAFKVNMDMLMKKSQKVIGTEKDCDHFLLRARDVINKISVYRPYLQAYGSRNLWIMKPGFQCRGQGIVILDNFFNIVNYAAKRSKACYMVQKYIERPFLVYKTKFDIRQYMLLTILDCVSIWIYNDCYLRFSSREFSLSDLRESIHVTNNSIQKKYKNSERDTRLPSHNMWALSQFQSFLNDNGHESAWSTKIFPGFKRSIISIVLASLEETDLTPNTFEIYGCDFMLDEELNPYLIEINSTPDMSPSTPVTAKMCPQALEDLMKVVLDHSKNSKISTGKFELIHQVTCPRFCNHSQELIVTGTTKKMHMPVTLSRKAKIRKYIKRKVLRKPRSSRMKMSTVGMQAKQNKS